MDPSIIPATLGRVVPAGSSRRGRRTDAHASFSDSLEEVGEDETRNRRGKDASEENKVDPELSHAALAPPGEDEVGTRLDLTA